MLMVESVDARISGKKKTEEREGKEVEARGRGPCVVQSLAQEVMGTTVNATHHLKSIELAKSATQAWTPGCPHRHCSPLTLVKV